MAFFGWKGHVPLGVALLLAAVLGALMVVIPMARIIQLRITARTPPRTPASFAAHPAQPVTREDAQEPRLDS